MNLNHSHGSPTNFRNERRKAAKKVKRSRQYRERAARLNLGVERLEERALMALGPTLIAINPNTGAVLQNGNTRNIAPTDLTFRFDDGQSIAASTLLSGISIVRTGGAGDAFGSAGTKADVTLTPGALVIGETPNEVVFRFAEALPDDDYRIIVSPNLKNVGGDAFDADRNTPGNQSFQMQFRLDLGPKVVAVVPQPVIRQANGTIAQLTLPVGGNPAVTTRNQIEVYFNNDRLDPVKAEDENFYQLSLTRDTANNLDDVVFNPTSAVYNQARNLVTLTFGQATDLANLGGVNQGVGTFRLRVGTNETVPVPPAVIAVGTDPDFKTNGAGAGSSFDVPGAAAMDLTGTPLDNGALILSSSIDPQFFPLDMPGSPDTPGSRDLGSGNAQTALLGSADTTIGITTQFYNFRRDYGFDPSGNPLTNAITPAQKELTRQIVELLGNYWGIRFVESETQGITVATGDIRAINPGAVTGKTGQPGLFDAGAQLVVINNAFEPVAGQPWNEDFGGSWFQEAMREISHVLGLGYLPDQPPETIQGTVLFPGTGPAGTVGSTGTRGIQPGDPSIQVGTSANQEPVFPGDQDNILGQYLHRPESKDIDLYKFQLNSEGVFTAETFAERQTNSSLLNSALRVYQETTNPDGSKSRTLIAQNDDYYGKDAFVQLSLGAGTYYVGVSASGNTSYDPTIADSGFGGTSQGSYDLRLDFRTKAANFLTDTGGTAFDGDSDGVPGGVYNFWFRSQTQAKTIFVDKVTTGTQTGTIANPFRTISAALAAAQTPAFAAPVGSPGQGALVRIIGNGVVDGAVRTAIPYEIGKNATTFAPLADGATLTVPKDTTVMIDAGAALKFLGSYVAVGSSSSVVDRSGSALQVLGTPELSVFFTSHKDSTLANSAAGTTGGGGDWGGVLFQSNLDKSSNRFLFEDRGIFMNYVNHADMRFGGGTVDVEGVPKTINPVSMVNTRPTISFNKISSSNDAAISANPDSFEETNFHSPQFQSTVPAGIQPPGTLGYSPDYTRVGPEIHNNRLTGNSLNGMLVRVTAFANATPEKMTVSGRFDDVDIVHILAENLQINGTPGGPIQDPSFTRPPVNLVTLTAQVTAGGTLAPSATTVYKYTVTFVDAAGNEGPLSLNSNNGTQFTRNSPTTSIPAGANSIRLAQLPTTSLPFVARKLYRSVSTDGGATFSVPDLVKVLDPSSTVYIDDGTTVHGAVGTTIPFRARLDARLAIDAGVIVKSSGERIEAMMGATLLAEGVEGRKVVFTSRRDDRYGAGGTFDTNNDGNSWLPTPASTTSLPVAGDWGGLVASPTSTLSLDHAVVAYGGGITRVGGSFAAFNPLEIYQATARVTNSIFEFNGNGKGGQAPADRFGYGFNDAAAIFVRGAQPIIVNNQFRNNQFSSTNTATQFNAAISINANALNSTFLADYGRSTGFASPFTTLGDNQGPLIRLNRLDGNKTNGMVVRGQTLTTQSVWDDADIVHVVTSTVQVPDFNVFGGLRIQSSATGSLVVKLFGATAGFTATGRPLETTDRIGGSLQIIGQPGFPVVLTSLRDDTVGSGFRRDGKPQGDTNGDGDFSLNTNDTTISRPAPGDWRSVLIGQFSHDRNVEVMGENESPTIAAPGVNGTINSAQFLGNLAPNEKSGDENLRLGFEVRGLLASPIDVDVYSFKAATGTEVWFDIDRTTMALDTVIELIDASGNVLAKSDNSLDERNDPTKLVGAAKLMQKAPPFQGQDFYSINPRDAGMRVVLPGPANQTNTYHIRVTSAGSKTFGAYQLQLRLREVDEVPGTTVRFSNIRYATNGIDIRGQVIHSPLLGEAQEIQTSANDTGPQRALYIAPNRGNAQDLGSLQAADRGAISTWGTLTNSTDIDYYRFQLDPQLAPPGDFGTIIDIDYADGLGRPDTSLAVFQERRVADPLDPLNPAADLLVYPLIYISQSSAFRATGSSGTTLNTNSNVAEDVVGQLGSADLTDLTRGSAGGLDAYIGPVGLTSGNEEGGRGPTNGSTRGATGIYFVAVTSDRVSPAEIVTNPLIRLDPVETVRRVVDDRLDNAPVTTGVETDPTVPILFDNGFTLVAPKGDRIVDGETFTITNTSGVSRTFEFNNGGGVSGTNIAVPFTVGSSVGAIALNIYDAVNGAGLGVSNPNGLPLRNTIVDRVPFSNSVAFPTRIRSISQRPAPGQVDTALFVSQPSIVPFNLGDVTLFVSRNTAANFNSTQIFTVDPYTGQFETLVGYTSQDLGDIAMRLDQGRLYAFSTNTDPVGDQPFDSGAGNFIEINPQTAATRIINDDGIETYELDPPNDPAAIRSHLIPSGARIGFGIQFTATAFGNLDNGGLLLYAAGDRGNTTPHTVADGTTGYDTNILYQFHPDTGLPNNGSDIRPGPNNSPPMLYEGAGTNVVEEGRLNTNQDAVPAVTNLVNTVAATTVTGPTTTFTINEGLNAVPGPAGVTVTVTVPSGPGAGTYVFEMDSGPDVRTNIDQTTLSTGNFVRDGQFFTIDSNNAFQFDTGPVFNLTAANNPAGNLFTDQRIFTLTDGGGVTRQFEFDLGGNGADVAGTDVTIPYSAGLSLTAIASNIVTAINGAGFGVQAQRMDIATGATNANTRITLLNDTGLTLDPLGIGSGFAVSGGYGDAPLVQTIAGNALLGTTFDVTVNGVTNTYTFANDNTGNNIKVDGATPDQVATAIAAKIPLIATRYLDKVVFNGLGITFQAGVGSGLVVIPTVQIAAEENSNTAAVGTAVTTAVNGASLAFTASSDGNRINFPGATSGDFTGMVVGGTGGTPTLFTDLNRVGGAQIPGAVAVPFAAFDDANAVANAIADVVNTTLVGVVQATVLGSSITFTELGANGAPTVTARGPFTTGGAVTGGGGKVTGMTFMPDANGVMRMYTVDDRGNLFQVLINGSESARFGNDIPMDWLGTLTDPVTNQPIVFQGLTTGPVNVEGGRYANTMFGISQTGMLYAFNRLGVLQPIFVNGESRVQAGLPDLSPGGNRITGLAFSNLDVNQWHFSTVAPGNLGTDDGGRNLYFGYESPDANLGRPRDPSFGNIDPTNSNNYNFPGGSYGSVTSNPFSLEGYSAADQPVLYFDYFADIGPNDSFRVFIAQDDPTFRTDNTGSWTQLPAATANTNNNWLQVRIPLDGFAGQKNLRLRFDFSTASDMNVGDATASERNTTGTELHAVDAKMLRDGDAFNTADTFTISGITFEFDLGVTLNAVPGSQIANHQTFNITSAGPTRVFEFCLNNEAVVTPGATRIQLTPTQTAAEVAQLMKLAILAAFGAGGLVTPHLNDERINLQGATGSNAPIINSPGANSITKLGAPGVAGTNRPVVVHGGMGAGEVAEVIRVALNNEFITNEGLLNGETFKVFGDHIHIIGNTIDARGPLGSNTSLGGDQLNTPNNNALPNFNAGGSMVGFNNPARGDDNNFLGATLRRGVHLDHLVIGFAERGERVRGSAGDAANSFTATPPGTRLLTGDYQLEIRRAEIPPSRIDTNDRLANAVTIVAPSGINLVDGQTFTISDGVSNMTFEYDNQADPLVGNSTTPGNIMIPFFPTDTDFVVAATIANVINSTDVQNVIKVTAVMSDGTLSADAIAGTALTASGFATGNLVNLFGAVEVRSNDVYINETGTGVGGTTGPTGNDTMSNVAANDFAFDTGIDTRLTAAKNIADPNQRFVPFYGRGFIGDNDTLGAQGASSALDRDLMKMVLRAGERVQIDIDAAQLGSTLDAFLRVFNSNGVELASNDDSAARDETFSLDSYLDFTAPADGTFYIGVSAFGNQTYNPTVALSGTPRTTGFYTINIRFGAPGNTNVEYKTYNVAGDQYGDQNQFRDQGQLLIQQNRIFDSLQFGIVTDNGAPSAPAITGAPGNPHAGSVALLAKANADGWAPGPTIMNNLIVRGGQGGIHVSGDTGTGPTAMLPFARLINNTIVGIGATLTIPTAGGGAGGITDGQQFTVTNNRIVGGVPTNVSQTFEFDNGTGPALGAGIVAIPFSSGAPGTGIGASTADQIANSIVNIVGVSTVLGLAPANVPVNAGGGRVVFGNSAPKPTIAAGPGGPAPTFTVINGTDVGVLVDQNASPTLLNNIVSSFSTGIRVADAGSSSTVVGGTLYHNIPAGNELTGPGAAANGGDSPLVVGAGSPMFINAALDNYYLAAGSAAVDSGIDSLEDRTNLKQVKEAVGIASSSILAPDRDLTGQKRVDIQGVGDTGSGTNPLKDRGAIDRADFIGPSAILINPQDNDVNGADQEPATTIVRLPDTAILTNFAIQLVDGFNPNNPLEGTGIDNSRVTLDKIIVTKDGVLQTAGTDYTIDYDTTNHVLRVVPLTGIWLPGSYVIELDNSPNRFLIQPLTGAQVQDGQTFTLVDRDSPVQHTVTFELDNGFNLTVPAAGGATGGITDGQQFTVTTSGAPVIFEFDDGTAPAPATGVIPVPFTSGAGASTANQIANAIVTAVTGVGALGLTGANAPVNVGGGRVVFGTNAAGTSPVVGFGTGPVATYTLTGRAGLNSPPSSNVRVPVTGGMTATQIANAIAAAISGNATLAGETVSVLPTNEVFVQNIFSFTSSNANLTAIQGGIRDLADNDLAPNQLDGTTRFTIILGDPLDYGDAPDTFKTLKVSDGARHRIVTGYSLGPTITADADGQLSPTGDASSDPGDDGVISNFVIQAGGPNANTFTFRVNLNTDVALGTPTTGFLNAWIDFNQDGLFQAGEQLIVGGTTNIPLVAGDNQLTITVPAEVPVPKVGGGFDPPLTRAGTNAIARFRLSSGGSLTANGPAADGEVEDYRFTIITGFPFRNPESLVLKPFNTPANTQDVGRLDVNNDGHVDTRDVFQIIAAFRMVGSPIAGINLPVPIQPGNFPNNPNPIAPSNSFFFVDTAGDPNVNFGFSDNRFDRFDIAAVIAQVNLNPFGEAEAVDFAGGEGEAVDFAPLVSAMSLPVGASQTAVIGPIAAPLPSSSGGTLLASVSAQSLDASPATSSGVADLGQSFTSSGQVELASGAVPRLIAHLAPQPEAPMLAGWEASLADIADEVGDEWLANQAVDSLFGDAATLVPESLATRTTARLPLARGRH